MQRGMARSEVPHIEGNQPGTALAQRCRQDGQVFGVGQTGKGRQIGWQWIRHDTQAPADDEAKSMKARGLLRLVWGIVLMVIAFALLAQAK